MAAKQETDPFPRFQSWFEEAQVSEPNDPNAMALATADSRGRPSARMVLLKGIDDHGFVFYTNVESRKGRELAENAHAALLFHWKSLRRQVRIEGTASRLSEDEARAYFSSRPRGSRIGAWASTQSAALEDRAVLEKRFREYEEKFKGEDVPLPPHWGFLSKWCPDRVRSSRRW